MSDVSDTAPSIGSSPGAGDWGSADFSALRAVVAATPDLIVRWDRPGRLLALNPAGRRLLALPQGADLSAFEISHFLGREAVARWATEVLAHVEDHGTWSGETSIRSRDGRPIDVSAVVVGHRDATGALASFSAVMRDITGRKQAEALLRRTGERDALTGLLNRHLLQSHLEKAVASAARGRGAALIVLDLDHFGHVNDALGRAAGDRFLITLAHRLDAGTRDEDVLARTGGDEFALLARGVTPDQALRIAEGLHALVSGYRFEDGEQWFGVGVSVGVAVIDGGISAMEVLARAEAASFAAKSEGRNRVEMWTPGEADVAMASSRSLWESLVEEAIESDRMRLVYLPVAQPTAIAGGGLGEPVHHEVLVRMLADDGRLIPPSAFLEAAERFGLARSIDRWVIDRALSAVAGAARVGKKLCLAVNLSSPALSDPDTIDAIIDGLNARNLNGSCLILEVPEPVAVTHVSELAYLTDCLSPRGVRLAIDDVGVGVSPFAYLGRLKADLLNLDASFTRDLAEDRGAGAMITSLAALAHEVGAKAVAKSVEDASLYSPLARYGVDFVQGWAIGPPGELPLT